MLSEVSKIVQTPGLTLIMLENDSVTRQIYTDGRKLPADPSPSWLDAMGHPHSEAMRLTERYRRLDFGHMEVETTVDDPKLYSRPFSVKVTHQLLADSDILEYICAENEKDNSHMSGK